MTATVQLRDADLRRLLAAAGELNHEQSEACPQDITGLLKLVARLIRCDGVSWSRLDVTARKTLSHATDPAELEGADDAVSDVFWEVYDEHPLCHGRGATMAVATLSDVIEPHALRHNRVYVECLRPLGVRHLIKAELTHPAGETNVILLDRGSGRDFDDRERLILTLLRPHLDAAVRRYLSPAIALTPREREVLTLVREGLTNRAVAKRLDVSTHTVRKHLENAFARLGVQSRTAAVARLRT
jgi:DNA-binding CsgD family transcriptional regulator